MKLGSTSTIVGEKKPWLNCAYLKRYF